MRVAAVLAVLANVSFAMCGQQHAVDIEQPANGRAFTADETAEIQRIADSAFHDVRAQLEGLPPRMTLILKWDKAVLPETGENGTSAYPGNVQWSVGPDRDVIAVARAQLRATMFHELHHLARASKVTTSWALRDRLVTEGLATAFERDFAHVTPPWGAPTTDEWTTELLAEPPGAPASADKWFHPLPDGRRFVGMRVGTHLADRAIAKTGKTSAQLVFASTNDVFAAAQ